MDCEPETFRPGDVVRQYPGYRFDPEYTVAIAQPVESVWPGVKQRLTLMRPGQVLYDLENTDLVLVRRGNAIRRLLWRVEEAGDADCE